MPASSWNLILFLGLLFGERIVRLASLHVAAFLDQFANFVGRDRALHWGQTFSAGATRKSWLLRIPFADIDLRLFGTATNAFSGRGTLGFP